MKLDQLLKKIHETQVEELSCSVCLDQVSAYVDLELDGEPAQAVMPQLKQHLDQCQICQDEYALLREIARLARESKLPPIETLQAQIRAAKSSRDTADRA